MKKLSVFGAGLLVAAAASAALLGAGTAAAAPDVTGDTYSDATSAIDDDGGKPVIATRVGDKLEQGDCIVTTVSDASFLRIDTSDESEVLLS
ncbi:MAG: hypothetical protein QOD39_3030, partial [Mycobacterium sp.]|nr:hypothetical protein [Mycobacterium sp.]